MPTGANVPRNRPGFSRNKENKRRAFPPSRPAPPKPLPLSRRDGALRLNLGAARRAAPTLGNDSLFRAVGASAPVEKSWVGMDRRAVLLLRRSRPLVPPTLPAKSSMANPYNLRSIPHEPDFREHTGFSLGNFPRRVAGARKNPAANRIEVHAPSIVSSRGCFCRHLPLAEIQEPSAHDPA